MPVTGRFDAGARLLTETGDNIGSTSRGAAPARAAASHDLASEAERSTWRSIW